MAPEPPCWPAFWVVPFVFPADEVAEELLDWLTLPAAITGVSVERSSWGLNPPTSPDAATLLAPDWVEVASDPAPCSLCASWPIPWIAPRGGCEQPSVHSGTVAAHTPQPACWAAFCVVPLVLPADEVADELLDWLTFPPPA